MDAEIQSYIFFGVCIAIFLWFLCFVINDSTTVSLDIYASPGHDQLIIRKALDNIGLQQEFQLKDGRSFIRYIEFVGEINNTIAISRYKNGIVYEWIDARLIKDIRNPL